MNRRSMLVAAAALAVAGAAPAQTALGESAPGPSSGATAPGHVYTPGRFTGIDISGSAIVQFVQGDEDRVVIEGSGNDEGAVDLDVRDGVLNIHPAGSWKFWKEGRPRVRVTARDLTRVAISGAADFQAAAPVSVRRLVVNISGAGLARFDHLQADELVFQVSGAGDGLVAGVARKLELRIAGRSDFRAEELMCEAAAVAISGVADARLWVTRDLRISVQGFGSIAYWGSPAVQRDISGRATVKDLGPKRPAS